MSDTTFTDLAIAVAPAPPGVNTPDLTDNLKQRRDAVADIGQAFSICDTMLYDSRDRIAQMAQIQQKIDGIIPPFSNVRLAEQGKLWQSNVPTGFLSSVAGIVEPRLAMRIMQAPTVTSSALPVGTPDAVEKTNLFQTTTTNAWRQWQQNVGFIMEVAHEVSIYGRAFVGFDDPWSIHPLVWRTDKAFIPEGFTIGGKDCQVFAAQRSYYIHELFERIEDEKAAKDAGWDIDATVAAINQASPVPAARPGDVTLARTYEDLLREVVMGYSWMQGANVINCWILLVSECDGSVSQWILCRDNNTLLFKANYPDDTMDEWVLPWNFQYGNGRFYGSFGVGQMLYDLSVQIEKTRNQVIDNFHKRNRVFAQVQDPKDLNKAKLLIQDDVVWVAGAVIAGNAAAYPALAQEFEQLDMYFTKLAMSKVGAFLPEPQVAGARPTATQALINSVKESEASSYVILSWVTNWLRMMWMFQKRLYMKGNPHPVAVEARKAVLGVMSEAELETILKHPAEVTIDYSESQRQKREQFLTGVLSAPPMAQYFNLYEVARQLATLSLDAASATAIMNPPNDQKGVIEGTRQQQEEVDFMQRDQPINVSPADDHVVSMAYLKGQPTPRGLSGPLPAALKAAAAALAIVHQNPDATMQAKELPIAQKFVKLSTLLYNHYLQHFDFAVQSKSLGEKENDEKAFISQSGKLLQTVTDALQKAMTPPAAPGAPAGQPAGNVSQFPLPAIAEPGQTPTEGIQ